MTLPLKIAAGRPPRCTHRRSAEQPPCPDCIHAWEDRQVEAAAEALYLWAARNTDAMIGGIWAAESEEFKDGWREDAKAILDAVDREKGRVP